jgi:membrane-bound inhibitor of C-type lysozyme
MTCKSAFAGMTILIGLALNLHAEPHAFPVPFVAKQHTTIAFTDLPGTGTIKIFTIAGEEVASLTIASGELIKQWNVTTSSGKKLASGVYLFVIDGGGTTKKGKLVVIR